LRLALCAAALLAVGMLPTPGRESLFQERTFFGIHKVHRVEATQAIELLHGSTLHGVQSLRPELRDEPLSYYGRQGPTGQFFAAWRKVAAGPQRVALVGLGGGALACYRIPGERWTVFEIDPVVERLARDPRYFRFLSDCAPDAEVRIGDARLRLAALPDGSFDLLILDAFSSDSIPTHLLTREAFALYVQHLAPGGVILLHISNRHLDLAPVVARLAAETRLTARVNGYAPGPDAPPLTSPSTWVALARTAGDLSALDGNAAWKPLTAATDTPAWSDDHADLIGAMRW
jgi:SAM-dependent methyltransferase